MKKIRYMALKDYKLIRWYGPGCSTIRKGDIGTFEKEHDCVIFLYPPVSCLTYNDTFTEVKYDSGTYPYRCPIEMKEILGNPEVFKRAGGIKDKKEIVN